MCRRAGFVGDEVYMLEGAIKGVAQIASGITGKHVYMRQVGNQDNYNVILAKWSRKLSSGKYNSHFVLMEDAKIVEYDSWPNSRTVKEGDIHSYRYIFAEVI